MSRHIFKIFYLFKWNLVLFSFKTQFKKKLAKFFVQADLHFISAGLSFPLGVFFSQILPHFILIVHRRFPINAFFAGIKNFIAKWLFRCYMEFFKMVRI